MSMFIVGAFFAVALLALVVALWLAYVEEQETLAKAEGKMTTMQILSSSTAPVASELRAPAQKSLREPLVKPVLQIAEKTSPLPALRGQSVPPLGNGQLSELARELRALHMQSREMNERLYALTLIVEQQLQKFPSHQTYIQEDMAV